MHGRKEETAVSMPADSTDAKRETVTHFYECGTEQELEAALKAWLQKKISELETGERARTHDA